MIYQAYKLKYAIRAQLTSDNLDRTGYTCTLQCKNYESTDLVNALTITMTRSSTSPNYTTTVFSLGTGNTSLTTSDYRSGDDDLEAYIEITNFRLLTTGRWAADTVETYCGGTLVQSVSGVSYNAGTLTRPCGIGSVGWGPELYGSIAGGMSALVGSVGTTSADVTLTISGGFSFQLKAGDSWSNLPVEICELPDPTTFDVGNVPAVYSLDWGTHFSATGSDSMQCIQTYSGENNYSYGFVDGWASTSGGRIYFASNEKPELKRFNSDFDARLVRTAVPSAEGTGRMSAMDRDAYPAYTTAQYGDYTYNTVLTSLASGAVDIDNTKSTLETDYLERDHYCGINSVVTYSYSKLAPFPGPYVPVIWKSESIEYDFPARVDGSATRVDAEYFDQIIHRWGHYNIPSYSPVVSGVGQNSNFSQSFRQFQLADTTVGTCWLGRPNSMPGINYTLANTFAASTSCSYTNASSSIITVPSGSRTFSSSAITVSGNTLYADLTSTSAIPYFYGMLADEVAFTVLVGSTDFQCWVEDDYGNRLELGIVGGRYQIPAYTPRKTYQSGYRNYGSRTIRDVSGSVVDIYFDDIPSNGISPAVYDGQFIISSERGYDGGWKRLVFTDTGSFSISYPTLYRNSLSIVPMGTDDFIFKNGDRYCKFRSSFDSASTIGLEAPGLPPRIGDWLVFKRWVLEGRDTLVSTPTVSGEIAGIAIASEGQTYAQMVNTTFSTYPRTFFVDDDCVLIKGWMNTQNNPHFVYSELSSSTLLPSGSGVTSDRWEYATTKRNLIGYDAELELWKDGAKVSTLASSGGPYVSTYSASALFADDYELRMNGRVLSDVWPMFAFDGYTSPPVTPRVAAAKSDDFLKCYAFSDGTDVYWKIYHDGGMLREGDFPGESVSVCSYDHKFYFACVTSSSSISVKKEDGTVSKSISTTDGVCPAICSFPDGEMGVYWIEGDVVYVSVVDSAFNTLISRTATTGIGSVDLEGIGGIIVEGTKGKPTVKIAVMQGGTLTIYSSSDFINFS